MKILIADDHNIIRYGTGMLLREHIPEVRISECADFDSLIEILKRETIDLLICDIKMPGGNNFKIIEVIRFYNPDIRILIFSAMKEENYAMRYLSAGANGYIQKDREEGELVTAVLTVMEKGRYVSQPLSEHLMEDALAGRKTGNNPITLLSDRELEIANLLLSGHTIGEISGILHIQTSTVSTYKSRLYEKLKVNQLADLIHIFSQYNNESD
jgi:two-component system, NarL family, invasion response regulator UvrY